MMSREDGPKYRRRQAGSKMDEDSFRITATSGTGEHDRQLKTEIEYKLNQQGDEVQVEKHR